MTILASYEQPFDAYDYHDYYRCYDEYESADDEPVVDASRRRADDLRKHPSHAIRTRTSYEYGVLRRVRQPDRRAGLPTRRSDSGRASPLKRPSPAIRTRTSTTTSTTTTATTSTTARLTSRSRTRRATRLWRTSPRRPSPAIRTGRVRLRVRHDCYDEYDSRLDEPVADTSEDVVEA